MSGDLKNTNALIFSYLTLRKTIGLLGASFPFVLAVGGRRHRQQPGRRLEPGVARLPFRRARPVVLLVYAGAACVRPSEQ